MITKDIESGFNVCDLQQCQTIMSVNVLQNILALYAWVPCRNICLLLSALFLHYLEDNRHHCQRHVQSSWALLTQDIHIQWHRLHWKPIWDTYIMWHKCMHPLISTLCWFPSTSATHTMQYLTTKENQAAFSRPKINKLLSKENNLVGSECQ